MCLGIPGQIVEVTDATRKLALVNVAGVKRKINVACVARDRSGFPTAAWAPGCWCTWASR